MQDSQPAKAPLWRQPLVAVSASAAVMIVAGVAVMFRLAEDVDNRPDRAPTPATTSAVPPAAPPGAGGDAQSVPAGDERVSAEFGKSQSPHQTASPSAASWTAGAVLAFDCESASRLDRQGALQLRDLSGYENNAQVTGGVWSEGKVGQAIEFSGAEGYLECADADSLNPTAALSIALWAKAKTWGTHSLVSKDDWEGGGTRGYVLRQSDNDCFDFTIGAGGWQGAQSGSGMQTGRWYHVAGVLDGKTIRLYVDGTERGSASCAASMEPSHYKLRIGNCEFSPERQFIGGVDEIAVWNRALSPVEVQNLYGYSNGGRSYCEAIAAVSPPLLTSRKPEGSPNVAQQNPKSESIETPASAANAPPPSAPGGQPTDSASPDWLKLDDNGEPCKVTLADGTAVKLETYGDEYEGYDWRPPMPAEKAEILVDYKRMGRGGFDGGGIQLDHQHKKMYWGETSGVDHPSSILRANFNGSDIEVVVDRRRPTFWALDPEGGKIYWLDRRANGTQSSIQRANLNGSNPETILPHAPGVSAIAVDGIARKLYRFELAGGEPPGHLLCSELDGSDEASIAKEPFAGQPSGTFFVDHESKRLYWDMDLWIIRGCGFDGGNFGNVVDVGKDCAHIDAFDLDAKLKKIYWSNSWANSHIRRANLDGSQIETIIAGIPLPTGLAVDAERQQIYWMESFLDDDGFQQVRVRRAQMPPLAKPKKFPAPPLVSRIVPFKQCAGGELTLTGRHFVVTNEVVFLDDGSGESVPAKFEERSDSELAVVTPRMSKRCRHPLIVVRSPGGLTVVLPRAVNMSHDEGLDRFHPDDQFAWLTPVAGGISIDRGAVVALGESIVTPTSTGKVTFFLKNHATLVFRDVPDNLVYFEPFAMINEIGNAPETQQRPSPPEGTRLVPVPAIRPSFIEAPLEYQPKE